MIYHQSPPNFNPRFEVASCIIKCQGSILLLHRQDHKPEGNTWCLPAGKCDSLEKPALAILREVQEETGIELEASQVAYAGKVYVRYPDYDFVYHVFRTELATRPPVCLHNAEHKDFQWTHPLVALQLDLIPDEDACIQHFLL